MATGLFLTTTLPKVSYLYFHLFDRTAHHIAVDVDAPQHALDFAIGDYLLALTLPRSVEERSLLTLFRFSDVDAQAGML